MVTIDLFVTKTDRKGTDSKVPIDASDSGKLTCPVTALRYYISVAEAYFNKKFGQSDHVFLMEDGTPLTLKVFASILKEIVKYAVSGQRNVEAS
ncbi:hypothetical protein AKO1_003127, partial [Acrasis kona]